MLWLRTAIVARLLTGRPYDPMSHGYRLACSNGPNLLWTVSNSIIPKNHEAHRRAGQEYSVIVQRQSPLKCRLASPRRVFLGHRGSPQHRTGVTGPGVLPLHSIFILRVTVCEPWRLNSANALDA